MNASFRRAAGVAVACAIALLIVRILEHLAHQVATPPGLSATNVREVETALDRGEFPFASFALVLAGWLLAAYIGSRVALRVGRATTPAWIFTMLFTAMTLLDLAALPHPVWMWVGGVVGVPLVGLGAMGESIHLGTA